ncbi:hypothetical protein [Vacuolonema iberomarrocanum]|uniref:hypothetical protein n=1 Tax=Vacuolonema iberomarrocanum TaxID=3454632 RepID=UPI001A04FB75|nr:hypothetical protein [filamentous cyanobacterium LEGE 07170]
MKVIWHDASIYNGDFDSKSHELKLFIEFNANLATESATVSDKFMTDVCVFGYAQETPEIFEFLDRLSQGEHIFADVISYKAEEKEGHTTTILKVSLIDCIHHVNDFFVLSINSESYEFQASA